MKYGGIKAGAPQLGDLLADYLNDNPLRGEIIAPVPMHSRRLRERGYNQAELLARRVAAQSELSYERDLLFRTRQVEPQAGIGSAAQRTVNVAGSIGVSADRDVSGARVILVDDVATTGSTLETCAGALKQAGAVSVWCLTLAVAGGESLAE
ncbi:MAG: phosphoribosyltransferase family protein [Chloroflexota bacterium]|nr:phosphoribosyltransferase family protein [Chloroflexota bacterium]MDE2684430.1 phosphoribosyltransferase family protein [Chloroflexota bacterium]